MDSHENFRCKQYMLACLKSLAFSFLTFFETASCSFFIRISPKISVLLLSTMRYLQPNTIYMRKISIFPFYLSLSSHSSKGRVPFKQKRMGGEKKSRRNKGVVASSMNESREGVKNRRWAEADQACTCWIVCSFVTARSHCLIHVSRWGVD